jgi:hypothetical protein
VFSGIFLQCFTVKLLPPPFFKTHYLHSSLFKFETNETCGQLNLLSGHETAVQFFSSVPSVQSWNKRRLYNSSHPYRQYSPETRDACTILLIRTISTGLKKETAVQFFSSLRSMQSWNKITVQFFSTVPSVQSLIYRVMNPVHSRFRIHYSIYGLPDLTFIIL